MKIQIDFREKDIVEHLQKELELDILSLPIGDFIIEKEKDDIYIIERKTISDLSASIKDGRFREQKQRLLESVKNESNIIYIIEGKWTSKLLSKEIIDSAILNLIFLHNYKVIRTNSCEETAQILCRLYKKIEKGDFTNIKQVNPIKLIGKGEKQKTRIFENQLCMISGVSMKIAEQIKMKYQNMFCLINEYNKKETEEEKEKLLIDISITDKRKIGKAMSKKIYTSLIFSDKQDEE